MKMHSKRSSLLSTIGRLWPFALLLVVATAGIHGAAWAQVTITDGCLEEAAGFGVNCTANDVGIAEATNIEILDPLADPDDPGCAFLGDTVTFTADFTVDLTAQARHDIGIYFANDGDPEGDGARTGFCTISTVPYTPEPDWLDLDGVNDDPGGVQQDTCGDIDANHDPLYPRLTLTVACIDDDGDNQLDLPYCTSWRQPGANDLCTVPEDAYPGSPSKCKCDPGFEVPIYVPPPTLIEVVKELMPSDDPGLFDLQIDGTTEAADQGDAGTTGSISVSVGDHTVGEVAGTGTSLAAYSSSISCVDREQPSTVLFSCPDCTVLTVNMPEEGGDYICTITNDLKRGSLTVIKQVVNDNGGTAIESDFTILLGDPGETSFPGAAAPGIKTEFDAGTTFDVSEDMGSLAGRYSATFTGDCAGTIEPGVDKTCTVTNDDDAPSLTLTKYVTNDNGGTAVAADWTLSAAGPTPISGPGGANSESSFSAGTYVLSESTGAAGYSAGSWTCTGGTQNGDQVTVELGDTVSCSITNDDDPPSLTLTKYVTNDNGGTAVATDWTLSASGPTSISGAGGASSDATFSAGTYALSETTGPAGYSAGSWTCSGGTQNGSQITLALGQSASCSITNDDDAPSLTLTKYVTNDNGGTAVATDWTLSASGPTPISGAGGASSDSTFDAGTYTLSESGPSGYTASSWSCSGGTQNGSQITLGLGQSASCSITNDDDAPSLTLTKYVTNDNGGTAVSTDWTLSASGPTSISGAGNATSGPSFDAGTYSLSETGPSGYTASSWSCTGGTQNGDQITVGLGESAACSITNDDDAPSLTLTKHVTNDNGGTAVATDWTLSASGPTPISGAGGASSDATFDAGTYTLSESGPSGYTASSWSCSGGTQNGDQITVGLGESASCSITNDDNPPGLTLTKHVTNDNGGTAVATDWTLSASGPTPISGAGGASSDSEFDAGTYTLSETGPSGYTASSWSCSGGTQNGDQITVGLGESASCSITNDDSPPSLTLTKHVTNDNGGTAVATDWTLSASGPTPISGAGGASSDSTFDAGTYTLSESGPSGYTASSWSCTGGTQNGDQITVGLGESASCSITNDDDPPSLTLTKYVTNDNGGTAVATDWTLSASGPTPISGAGGASSDATFDAGTYTLSETGPSGYTASSWSCNGGTQSGDQITVGLGESASCSITNDDDAPGLTLVKVVTNDNGGTAVATDWMLTASGPTPISGAGGASSDATFDAGTYSLSESGPSGYTASSWSCSGGTQSGDQITVGLGESASCSITNDDDAPSLTLTKYVTNDNGGTAVATDWTLMASGPTTISGAGGASSGASFDAGTYTLSETGPSGYTASSWSCSGGTQSGDQITVGLGESASCSITNDDDVPGLTLTKIVVNDNGGTAVATDWMLTASGPTPISGAGGASSDATFSAGTYALSESGGPSGYTASSWSCTGGTQNGDQITVGLGESANCSITNDDDAPGLTLTKIVVNDNGGTAVATDWMLTASGPTPISGAGGASSDATFSAGTYTLSESGGPAGYTASSWSCTGGTQSGDQITVGLGQSASCSITNDDDVPSLTLTKIVVNDNGGTAVATDWMLTASGPTPISGAGGASSDATFSAGTYTLSESGTVTGYSASDWSCSGGSQSGDQITVGLGESASCAITNNDIAPQLTITKVVFGDPASDPFRFTAPGLPASGDTFTLPAAGGSAVFTPNAGRYTVSEDVLDTGTTSSEWALTSVECVGVTPDPQSPDRGVTFDLPLGIQAECTFTNRFAALDVEKSCVNEEPAIGDTVVFSIRTMNTGVVSLPVTVDDELIPAIDGLQYVLEAGDGVCELSEFEDSPGDPDAGGEDGCVEFVEEVTILVPFFDIENEATLSASMLAEPFEDIAVALTDTSDAICDVPGPATRTRGFWGNRIAREDENGDPTADGFTCFAFENWVLAEYPAGVDLGWSAPPVATCEQLAASFFSHPSKNSDNSRRRRSCQTNYKITIDLMVLILNTWLPQNGEPLPGDTVPVRLKDVFDLFPWPGGDGVPETSMVDLIDEMLSALATDHLTDGTPCNSGCKRSLGGLADLIANSGDSTAIIIDGDEQNFGGDFHAYPQASRALGADSIEQFDCGTRNQGGGPRTQGGGPPKVDLPKPGTVSTPSVTEGETTPEAAPRGRGFDARQLPDREQSVLPQETVEEPLTIDEEVPISPDSESARWDSLGRGLWAPEPSIGSETEDSEIQREEEGEERSGVSISAVDMRLDEERWVLSGGMTFSADESVALEALWINEVSLTVLERVGDDGDWNEVASPARCRLESDLPLDLTAQAGSEAGTRVSFTCELDRAIDAEATVRLKTEAVDGLWLDIPSHDRATKL